MYAIVDIAGQQFKVEKEQKLFVHRLPGDEDSNVSFDSVLLIDNDGKVTLGKPIIDGASVSAKILSHVKGDKVLVFKKKRRKGYQTLNGHRQLFTQIQIEKIQEKGGKRASAKAEDTPVAAEAEKEVKAKVKTAPKKAATKSKVAAKPKAASPKKKPAVKKTTKKDLKK
ncbi:MAG TPA: 50S ribosomal protein L21 [Flavobacteriales bacterium]|jgi:large subunit ribosomal protein L21|nr:50S ribosomal protein L21 [Flavobacteriales bacterium]